MLAVVGFAHLMSPPVWSRALTQASVTGPKFQVAGSRLWNSLPASLRQSDTTVGQFKKLLKSQHRKQCIAAGSSVYREGS